MNRKALLKTAGNFLLILVIGLLTYKFIMWNYWKVERASALAKGIIAAPPAVNITLAKEKAPLYQSGFAHNPASYYLVNQFDISPYIDRNSNLSLEVSINGQKVESPHLYPFKTYNVIRCREIYLVFTTRACSIEEFVKLKDSLPSLLRDLDAGEMVNLPAGGESLVDNPPQEQ
jgi:hypothetical protein